MTITKPSSLKASALEIQWTKEPKPVPAPGSPEITSLKATTDHMITVSWTSAKGWDNPKLVPYGPIPLMPSANVIHYATSCFEGMKVYRGFDGRLRLHRPLYNCNRMLSSAERISSPGFEPEELLKLIHKLCVIEAPKWLPKAKTGSMLYIRPTLIGTDSSLGLRVPEEALLYIFLIHWPSLNPTTAPNDDNKKNGVRLLASTESTVRAWPGGTGAAKVAANYGPTIQAQGEARRLAGSANVFVIQRASTGALQMVTPPLDERKIILAGGTRRSILELSRKMFAGGPANEEAEEVEVLESDITMSHIVRSVDDDSLVAVFVVGTAAWVQPVAEIMFDGRTIRLPLGKVPHVSLLKEKLESIVYGKETSPWGEVIDESE
ncbi:Branched-chain-amino-acid aminotransferase [Colletotrichum gloeosporioides]|uniref:Branched-chain-amino-acid aminotransferase n=1 Tax=Colletotrichum gloeosporioides TaxID=474922 RepID=A0A8H4CNH2_COLGL|nr:Branched-chain-amino-acid aminotransferase [Colletotrichum gloeosporioides]KAF3807031.1 Branched-chain-amino-acid aminotransferase [Colletotrichum gloeosporioides]